MSKKYQIKTVKKLFAVLLIFSFIIIPNAVSAVSLHVFHTSLTRIDYNIKQKTLEVSMQLFTHDLVPLLEQKSGKRVDLEKTPDVDKLILNYLNENFILKDEKGETKQIKWVGKELDVDTAWVYFEFASDKSPEGFTLQNTLFFESFPEQTNLVIARFNEKKADLFYKVGDKFKEIKQSVLPEQR